jgi:hypothetical protein
MSAGTHEKRRLVKITGSNARMENGKKKKKKHILHKKELTKV